MALKNYDDMTDAEWARYVGNDAPCARRSWFVRAARGLCAPLAALLLSGCAPHVRYIPIPCLTKDQVLPSEPEHVKDHLTGHADEDLKIVAGSAIRLRAYGEGLRGILEGCRAK